MSGSTARVMVTRPWQLVAIMVSQSSSGTSWAGAVFSARPALFTSTSIGFHSGGRPDRAASIEARLVTSSVTARALSPSSRARSAMRSVRRAARTTRWPWETKVRAISAPKPADAPVMKTIMMGPWMATG